MITIVLPEWLAWFLVVTIPLGIVLNTIASIIEWRIATKQRRK